MEDELSQIIDQRIYFEIMFKNIKFLYIQLLIVFRVLYIDLIERMYLNILNTILVSRCVPFDSLN